MVPKTLEEFSKEFYENDKTESGIFWMATWGLGFVKSEELWKILELAMPHKVVLPEHFYGKYKKIYKWLDKNSTGLWTHSQLNFVFEKENDAFIFKMRWL